MKGLVRMPWLKAMCTCRVSNHPCPVHPDPITQAILKVKKWR